MSSSLTRFEVARSPRPLRGDSRETVVGYVVAVVDDVAFPVASYGVADAGDFNMVAFRFADVAVVAGVIPERIGVVQRFGKFDFGEFGQLGDGDLQRVDVDPTGAALIAY